MGRQRRLQVPSDKYPNKPLSITLPKERKEKTNMDELVDTVPVSSGKQAMVLSLDFEVYAPTLPGKTLYSCITVVSLLNYCNS